MNDPWLEELSQNECMELLRRECVGRIAVITDQGPIVLPVNYRVVEAPSGPLLAVRTRPGNVIAQAPESVAFEIDAINPVNHEGWSVLVRGELLHADPTSAAFRDLYDPNPWLADRDAWLLIDFWAVSGRRLHGPDLLWRYRPGEYV